MVKTRSLYLTQGLIQYRVLTDRQTDGIRTASMRLALSIKMHTTDMTKTNHWNFICSMFIVENESKVKSNYKPMVLFLMTGGSAVLLSRRSSKNSLLSVSSGFRITTTSWQDSLNNSRTCQHGKWHDKLGQQALLKAKYCPRVATASCTQKNTPNPCDLDVWWMTLSSVGS